MAKLIAELNQELLRGGQKLPRRVLNRTLGKIEKVLKPKKTAKISIAFVSDREIKKLNASYRGKDCVTDVLSFPMHDSEVFGEILISYNQAKRQAKKIKHSTRAEVNFLIVHGILHLFGYDHESLKDAKKMFPLQNKILDSLGIDTRL